MSRPPNNRLVLAVILGVVTTFGVAWTLAVVRPISTSPRMMARTFILHDRAWNTAEHHLLGVTDIWWIELTGRSSSSAAVTTIAERIAEARASHAEILNYRPGFVALESPPPWGTLAPAVGAAELPAASVHGADTAFGFPLPCLWHRAISPLRGNVSYAGGLDGGILLRGTAQARGPNDYTALPFRPIWTAFLLNTVVYAAVWLLLLTALGAVRARGRVRRNLCPQCAYDLSATPLDRPCPECGRLTSGRRSGVVR